MESDTYKHLLIVITLIPLLVTAMNYNSNPCGALFPIDVVINVFGMIKYIEIFLFLTII